LFDKKDTAKLKDQKSLHEAGEFLANNQYGFAVVVVSAGKEGDAVKQLALSEARAMVVREYLTENFGFDDNQLKTLGVGKQTYAASDSDWGTVQIFIYGAGTQIPRNKGTQTVIASPAASVQPTQTVLP
jgi:hypothetical protein